MGTRKIVSSNTVQCYRIILIAIYVTLFEPSSNVTLWKRAKRTFYKNINQQSETQPKLRTGNENYNTYFTEVIFKSSMPSQFTTTLTSLI
jgi:hypothetical protein